ncbi:pol, partial [Mucuna pruriens]
MGIDFMGPFLISNGYSYILLVVEYVLRWVEATTNKTNDAKLVVDLLKSNIFCRFGVPKALIIDQGSHFYSRAMSSSLEKYGVAIKQCNLAYDQADKERKLQLLELEEIRSEHMRTLGSTRKRLDGPFVITNVFPYGVVELKDEATNNTFQVNGHQLKIFHEGLTQTVGEVESISLMEPAIADDAP